MSFENVIMPVDIDQPLAELENAAQFVELLGIQSLVLTYVINRDNLNTKRCLERLRLIADKMTCLKCDVSVEVGEGHVASEICRLAGQNESDYIYIPRSPEHRLRRLLLGSTTRDVIRMTDIPVFVHKFRPHPAPAEITRILYATDFGSAAERAFPYLPRFASPSRILRFLHVGKRAPDPFAEEKRQEFVNATLGQCAEELKESFGEIQTREILGTPHKVIVNTAKSFHADLLIAGRFNDNPLRKIIGSTAERVADKAECSLFVVP